MSSFLHGFSVDYPWARRERSGPALTVRIAILSDSEFNRRALEHATASCERHVTYRGAVTFPAVRDALRCGPDVFLLDVGGSYPASLLEVCDHLVSKNKVVVGVATSLPDSPALPALLLAGLAAYTTLALNMDQLRSMLVSVERNHGFLSIGLGPIAIPGLRGRAVPFTFGMLTASLTGAERDILRMMGDGEHDRKIAEAMNRESTTIKHNIERLIQKCDLRTRFQLGVWARDGGLVRSREGVGADLPTRSHRPRFQAADPASARPGDPSAAQSSGGSNLGVFLAGTGSLTCEREAQ